MWKSSRKGVWTVYKRAERCRSFRISAWQFGPILGWDCGYDRICGTVATVTMLLLVLLLSDMSVMYSDASITPKHQNAPVQRIGSSDAIARR
jgi:hypothetical protein